MQNIQTSLMPFGLTTDRTEVPEGLNLQEIVDHVMPFKIQGVRIIITIGGERINQQLWSKVKPKQHSLVSINVVPAGGKGKKNPLVAILSIAVLIAAPYIAGYATAAAISSGTVSTLAGAKAVYGAVRLGVGLVGFLATSALSSTPSQSTPRQNIAESSTQFIEGASNAVDPYGVIPANIGTNRVFPKQAALPYTEVSGGDQYVRQLMTYGYGEHVILNRRIGDTKLSEYEDVEIEDKLEGNLNEGTSLYTNDVYQEGFSAVISKSGGAVVRTTRTNIDEAIIDITFAGGLTKYDDEGLRQNTSVFFDIKYAPTGTTDWKSFEGDRTFTGGSAVASEPIKAIFTYVNNAGLVYIHKETGQVRAFTYTTGNDKPTVSPNWLLLASYEVQFLPGGEFEISTFKDHRNNAVSSGIIESLSEFPLSYSGKTVTVGGGTLTGPPTHWKSSTAQPFRVSKRFVFPSKGQYDISFERLTSDSSDDKIRDEATLSSIKSVKYIQPVRQANISGSSLRMRGTDQLNGTVDRYNVDLTTICLYYDRDEGEWLKGSSANPAAALRYVLQTPAFLKRLPDERIDLEMLEEWYEYCEDNNFTYNRNIDYVVSIDDVINDICAAGFATISKVDGIYSVIIDNEKPIISGMVTPRNSYGYSGNINYPDIPHALRVEFRNKEKNYEIDERIVYAPGYDEDTAEEYERLDFPSCDNATLAYYYGKRYFLTAILQPETHNFNMDFENLTFNRGDRITFVQDSILVGVGQGRIVSLTYDDDLSPTEITGFVIDDVVEIPTTNQFGVRIRKANASGLPYHLLTTIVGKTDTFEFAEPIEIETDQASSELEYINSLCAFVEDGLELDLLVVDIRRGKQETAKISAVNYAPERFTPFTGDTPVFSSNITLPLSFYQPLPPSLDGAIQSDETVMQRNSDGSFLTKMVIPLNNPNESSILPIIRVKPSDSNIWFRPSVLIATAEWIEITGLQDGTSYDIEIRYQRSSGQTLASLPLILNSVKYEGASANPSDVEEFKVAVSDTTGLFEWSPVEDIDLSFYRIKFSRLTSGAKWSTAQLASDRVKGNRTSLPIQSGTYLIKAVDILGNESDNATLITSFDNGSLKNQVEKLVGQSEWSGVKENCEAYEGNLLLQDTSLPGYYYFDPNPLDLSELYENVISTSLSGIGVRHKRVRDIIRIRDETTLRGAEGLRIRSSLRIRDEDSIRGIDSSSWSIIMQISQSSDGVTYTDWQDLNAGKHIFRFAKFRLKISSWDLFISPSVSIAEVVIDMPDRRESAEDVSCPPEGVTIDYGDPFKNNPAVNITLQDGSAGDEIVFDSKNSSGFTVRVYNATVEEYVTRTFDFISAGYGKVA